MTQQGFDADMGRRLDRMYRTRDVLRRRRLVCEAVAPAPGEHILDVGCGPGFYLAELVDVVGSNGSVTGVDSSPAMLGIAVQRCDGHGNVTLREGKATRLPVDDANFDAALSVQVLEYVRDASAALAELHRALKPGGRVVVWDVDWSTVSWHSYEQARMDRILEVWDQHLAHPSLPRTLALRMRSVGFRDVSFEPHVFASGEYDADTYGVQAIPLIEDFVAGRDGVDAGEAAAWAAEQRDLGDRGEFFFTCTQFCFRGTKPI